MYVADVVWAVDTVDQGVPEVSLAWGHVLHYFRGFSSPRGRFRLDFRWRHFSVVFFVLPKSFYVFHVLGGWRESRKFFPNLHADCLKCVSASLGASRCVKVIGGWESARQKDCVLSDKAHL